VRSLSGKNVKIIKSAMRIYFKMYYQLQMMPIFPIVKFIFHKL
jgi:hypothetical protein